jgi:hypothetical protein
MAMAKKPVRSDANDVTTSDAPSKAKPRSRGQRELGAAAAVSNREADPVKLGVDTEGPETISRSLENPDSLGQSAERVQQAPGDAMASRQDQPPQPAGPSEEDIRARAYQMYLERGGHHGLDFDDWVRAERELRNER